MIATNIENGVVRYSLSAPYEIGPRLMPALRMPDGSRVSITVDGQDIDGRIVYRWTIDGADGTELAAGRDLRSGAYAEPDVGAMFPSLASFLSAWVESFGYPDSENADLFPDSLRDWAERNAEELSMMTMEEEEE